MKTTFTKREWAALAALLNQLMIKAGKSAEDRHAFFMEIISMKISETENEMVFDLNKGIAERELVFLCDVIRNNASAYVNLMLAVKSVFNAIDTLFSGLSGYKNSIMNDFRKIEHFFAGGLNTKKKIAEVA